MAVKGINPASKCYVDVYSVAEIDDMFEEWEGLSSAQLNNNANLNNYKTIGLYYCRNNSIAATISNAPTNNAFSLFVEKHAGIKQTVTRYHPLYPQTWVRNFYDDTWGEWTRINNTIEDPQIYSGTSTPSGSLGKDGDVYFLY